jgi:hypothetical protein
MLRDLLTRTTLSFTDRCQVRAALRERWCWPADPRLAQIARDYAAEPAQPPPGEVLLVSVSDDETEGALWCARRVTAGARLSTAGPTHFDVPLVDTAQGAAVLAEKLVSRALPYLVRLDALRGPTSWSATLLCASGDAAPHVLKGQSFGLSLLLGSAALLMDEPLDAGLAASAALNPDGTLRAVEGLQRKIDMLADGALGVRRLLVQSDQAAEARQAVSACGGDLEIVPVATAADAVTIAFPDAATRPRPEWDDPSVVSADAERLFRLTLLGASLLKWSAVARAAEWLVEHAPPTSVARHKATTALAIARRHEDENTLIRWPEQEFLDTLAPVIQRNLLAHVIQSARDAGSDELPTYIARARALVDPPRHGDDSELRVIGALGRGLAALRRYAEAQAMLSTAVEGWRAIYRADGSSYALCELLRVIGIRSDTAALVGLEPALEDYTLESHDYVADGFVRLARGRARVQLGQAEAALELLEDAGFEWQLTPDHLGQARERWLARALAAVGDEARASVMRKQLKQCSPDADQAVLADLDAALESQSGTEAASLLDRLRQQEAGSSRWLWDAGLTILEQARRIADEYPY